MSKVALGGGESAVVPVRILVARSQSDILAEVIAAAIRNTADFELVANAVVPLSRAESILCEQGAHLDVLIAVGDPPGATLNALLATYSNIIVSHIAVGCDTVQFDLRNIGIEKLLSSVRVLARSGRSERGERTLAYKVVGHPSSASGGECELVVVDSSDGALISHALAWIDAAVMLHRRKNPPERDDLPGLARGGASVENTLRPPTSHPEIQQARRTLADAERQLMSLLDVADPEQEPLAAMHRNLRLTSLEFQVVLLCLAPELDVKYQSVYGVLNDDLGRRTATLGLVCALLDETFDANCALRRSGGLTRWRLFESGATLPHADEPLRLEPVIVAWLFGDGQALLADIRLRQFVRRRPWAGAQWIRPEDKACLRDSIARARSGSADDAAWTMLAGDDSDGWGAMVEGGAGKEGMPLIRLSLASFAGADTVDAEEIGARLARASQLIGAVPVVDASATKPEAIDIEAVARLITPLCEMGRPGFVISRDVQRLIGGFPRQRCHLLHRDRRDSADLAMAFSAAARDSGLHLATEDAERLAMTFPLPLQGIDDAVRLATLHGAAVEPPAQQYSLVSAACRRVASPDLPRFARRVEPAFRLDQVVLPQDRLSQLNEMVAHVHYAAKVLNDWGFSGQLPYGRGVAALFCGPSGTGKTMAAHAIAYELQREAYVVDLSRVVSKYIGESEKNLDAVFNDAERAGAVLLFDEADALFGKRSEVKDAHDRYANIEVAYLLQRMEAFAGLAILTTNFRQNLDQAFLRRLRFVVEFPLPGTEARETIWRQCLPEAAPRSTDIDFRFLSRRLELTGGNIQQITVRAAFAAASETSDAITIHHVVEATRAELLKLGMLGAERDLAEFERSLRQSQPAQAA